MASPLSSSTVVSHRILSLHHPPLNRSLVFVKPKLPFSRTVSRDLRMRLHSETTNYGDKVGFIALERCHTWVRYKVPNFAFWIFVFSSAGTYTFFNRFKVEPFGRSWIKESRESSCNDPDTSSSVVSIALVWSRLCVHLTCRGGSLLSGH